MNVIYIWTPWLSMFLKNHNYAFYTAFNTILNQFLLNMFALLKFVETKIRIIISIN